MPMTEHGFLPIRVFFEKRGRIKYISHLDVMRAFTRALGRSGLPLWHTEGFNPHLYLTFALPLSLGCEGLCESFDARLTEEMDFDEVTARIGAVLPPGFRALRCAEPIQKPAAIAWADYEITLRYGDRAQEARSALESFAASGQIEVMKRTKKGDKAIDIAPHAKLLSAEADDGALHLTLRLAAGINLNINPGLYLDAFYAAYGQPPELRQIVRLRLLDGDLREFE